MESALRLHETPVRHSLERHLNLSIGDLAAAREALATLTAEYQDRGAVGIKLAHAYTRTLHSLPVPAARAAAVYAKALAGGTPDAGEVKDLQDHLIFFLAELAQDRKLVFQIHTGVQGNWGNVPDSDPLLLIPLLKAFPEVRFDLFHAGYPYSRMLGMLGKHYPNVWLNLAWMYVISIAASRQLLSEWLDLVPGYRLLGFGSDVQFPEMILGHLEMARSCVADVLAEKVRLDYLGEEEAFCLARRMFRDNAMELYGLRPKAGEE
jgi:predicted TIM-barrel fold metal-dependent hydrolase